MVYHKIAHFVIMVSCIIIPPAHLKAGDETASSSSSSSSDSHQLREIGERVLKKVNLWGSFVYFAFNGLQEAQKNIEVYERDVADNNACLVELNKKVEVLQAKHDDLLAGLATLSTAGVDYLDKYRDKHKAATSELQQYQKCRDLKKDLNLLGHIPRSLLRLFCLDKNAMIVG